MLYVRWFAVASKTHCQIHKQLVGASYPGGSTLLVAQGPSVVTLTTSATPGTAEPSVTVISLPVVAFLAEPSTRQMCRFNSSPCRPAQGPAMVGTVTAVTTLFGVAAVFRSRPFLLIPPRIFRARLSISHPNRPSRCRHHFHIRFQWEQAQ